MKAQQTKSAENRVTEILKLLHYDPNSLTHLLVRAYRNGMAKESADKAILEIKKACDDSLATYHAAVAQPEPKVTERPVIEL